MKIADLFDRTPNKAIRVAAGVAAANGLILGYHLFQLARAVQANENRQMFLMDIIQRKVSITDLEEFDIIALRELGLLREKN